MHVQRGVAAIGGLLALGVACAIMGVVFLREETAVSSEVDPFELPLEQYLLDTTRHGTAMRGLIGECMADQEWDYPREVVDLSRHEPQTSTRLGYFVMTDARAEKFGYREQADPRIVERARPVADVVPQSSDPGYRKALKRCTDSAYSTLGNYVDPGNVVLILDGQSRDSANHDPGVDAAIARWRACMVENGLREGLDGGSDRPDGPDGYRIHVLQTMDDKYHPGEVDTMTLTPTPDEIDLARQDVQCRAESGYSTAYLGAVERAQDRLVAENRERLERAGEEMVAIEMAVDKELRRMRL